MNRIMKYALPVIFAAATAASAHAQIFTLKGASIAIGADEEFTRTLTSSSTSATYTVGNTGGGTLQETISGLQQYTTQSGGGVVSLDLHPKPWAGVEFNYGLYRYSERYAFNYTGSAGQSVNVTNFQHEATGAYIFHPKHIKFQPFVGIGGGGIDFLPSSPNATNQWRGTGLLETGFDIPSGYTHLAFRVEGRTLIYRAPDFNNGALNTSSWRATNQPLVSAVFRF